MTAASRRFRAWPPRSNRARRLGAAPELDHGDGPSADFASSFAADLVGAGSRSAEQWAGSILAEAPSLLGWFVVLGWRSVLRLRLAPPQEHAVIAGWRVTANQPDAVTLEVGSSLVTARKVLTVEADRLTLTTYVWFRGVRGCVLWSALVPVHHRIEPLLMRLAVARHLAKEPAAPKGDPPAW